MMLKEFKFGNFRSFKEIQTLSMEPMSISRPDLDCFNISELKKERILKTAVVYGHNSFGKSNIFKAIEDMLDVIKNCTNPSYKISIDCFKLDDFSRDNPSFFELTIVLGEITYRYGFEILGNKVHKEWLYKKNIREVNVFNREGTLGESIKPSTSYGSLKKYIKFTRDEELFLSSIVKLNEQGELRTLYNYILSDIKIISGDSINKSTTSFILSDRSWYRDKVIKAMQSADLGIEDIEITEEEEDIESLPSYYRNYLKERLSGELGDKNALIRMYETFKHKVYDKNNKQIGVESFSVDESESQGTIKLYSLIGPIIDALENGYVLFVDELDSKLHHLITKYIIDLFHDLSLNTNNAQLIFNTHDMYLLKENIFRKDQVYFTDKNKYGESTLYSLGDFKGLDNKANILSHYLAGNFGSLGSIKMEE